MSAKVSFNQPLKSLTFCGAENIAALFDNDFRIAWSSTGTHYSTIEVDRSSSDVFGTCDSIFVTDGWDEATRPPFVESDLHIRSQRRRVLFSMQECQHRDALHGDGTSRQRRRL
ncbi:hypothetical protein CRE_08312 [Caenorhabditis remanei]|uniref:Uncharacterized protein n=1 Tax=Caenorhabditis remanei TaxID=31234 RepID=E3M3L7_CAERE|nr:hypothetical protein CRE_08312 [Caenorhabditis remanei]